MAGGHTSETVDAAISHPVISQVDRSKGKSSRPGEEPRAWRTSECPSHNDRITLGTVFTGLRSAGGGVFVRGVA